MDDKGCLPRESGIHHKCPYRLTTFGTSPALAGEAKIAASPQGDSEAPASPAAAGEGNRVSGGRGACSDTVDNDQGAVARSFLASCNPHFYTGICIVHDIQLCYNINKIPAALRAVRDTAVFRTC